MLIIAHSKSIVHISQPLPQHGFHCVIHCDTAIPNTTAARIIIAQLLTFTKFIPHLF